MKKILISIISIICLASVIAFGGCKNTSEQPFLLKMNTQSISIVNEFDFQLSTNYQGKSTISWESENDDIACVDSNGLVKAVNVGNTVVTASVDGQSASCTITITPFDVALLKIIVESSQVTLSVDAQKDVAATLVYGNKILDGVNISMRSLSEDIVSVENGKINAKEVGETSVILSCEYNGYNSNTVVNVSVVSDIFELSIKQEKIQLYPLASFDDITYKNTLQLETIVYKNGVLYENAQIEYSSSNNDIFTVEDGIVVAKSVGVAILTASYGNVTDSVFVEIKPICSTLDTSVIDVDYASGFNLVDNGILVEGEILKVCVSDGDFEKELNYANGVVDFSSINYFGEKDLILKTDKINYTAKIYIWTALITDAESLKNLYTASTGRYKLINDIDLIDVEWDYQGYNTLFTGVLDGNGKSISNLTLVGSCGLLNKVGHGAVIKNLTLKGVYISDQATSCGALIGLVKNNSDVLVENVKIQASVNGENNGGLIGNVETSSIVTVKNFQSYVYSNGVNNLRGSMFGICSGSLVAEGENIIYSSLPICAPSDSGNSGEVDNKALSIVKPSQYNTNDNKVINTADAYINNLIFDFENLADIKKITLYSNTVKEFSSGRIKISGEDVDKITSGGVDVLISLTDGTYKYYRLETYTKLLLTKNNLFVLSKINGGEVILQEDIELLEEWKNDLNFTGVFDGQGHIINGLTPASNSGLFKSFSGTLKNIIFTNVKLSNGYSGTISKTIHGNVVLDNVFVEVIRVKETNGALIERVSGDNYKITANNLYIDLGIDGLTGTYPFAGFICGWLNKTYKASDFTNMVLVGGMGIYYQNKPVTDHTVYENKDAVIKAIEQKQLVVNEFIENAIVKGYGAVIPGTVLINQQNYQQLLSLKGNETVVLTGNLNLTGVEWNTSVNFNGSFDGQGYTIKGLKPSAGCGLFKKAQGIFKNIIFTDVDLSNNQTGTIACSLSGATVFENIFVQTKTVSTTRVGGLYEIGNQETTINNVFVDMADTQASYVAGYIYGWQDQKFNENNVTNVVFVGGSGLYGGMGTSLKEAPKQVVFDDAQSAYDAIVSNKITVNQFIFTAIKTVYGIE